MKTDLSLRQDVESELAWSPQVDASDVAVTARDGAVTLSGKVKSYFEKCEIERIAKQVYGVTGIANEVQVALGGAAKDDGDLLQDVLHALKFNLLIPRDTVKPTVRNGWVTLEGKVRWNFQRDRAEDSVRYLAGVTGVTNDIKIDNEPQPKDVSKRIEDAFARKAQLDARSISVSMIGNTAVLDGSVHSWAERDEAADAAWSAPGVSSVENHLRVTY